MPKKNKKEDIKRKSEDDYSKLMRKLRKIEKKLKENTPRRRIMSSTDDSDSESDDMRSSSDRSVSESVTRSKTNMPAPEPILNSVIKTNASNDNAVNQTVDANPVFTQGDAALTNASTASQVCIASTTPDTEMEIDEEMLALLGDAPIVDTKFGKATYKDLASRWQEILAKGLPKEVKEKILKEYLVPENCDLLIAPTLNPEVKAAIAENLVKRDLSLMNKQKQISTAIAIAAINQAIELSLSKESHAKILKYLSDACRLLCDTHYVDTKTRRGFVISAINSDMKETLNDTKRDKFLFGENIAEKTKIKKLKAAKTIQKSSTELKQKSQIFNKTIFLKNPKNTNPNRLNWKTLPRKTTAKSDTGKPRPSQGLRVAGSTSSQQRGLPVQTTARSYRRR